MKRPSLKDRGDLTTLLRGSEPAAAPASTVKPSKQYAGKPAKRQTGNKPTMTVDDALVKATFYLSLADLQMLETARTKRRAETGRRRGVDLSALVREAVRARFGR